MSGDQPNEEIRMIYYYQALGEVGFNAREKKGDLDRKLNIIWKDLQKIITQEEKSVDFQ